MQAHEVVPDPNVRRNQRGLSMEVGMLELLMHGLLEVNRVSLAKRLPWVYPA